MCLVSKGQIKTFSLSFHKITFFAKGTFNIVQHHFGTGFNGVIVRTTRNKIQRFGMGMFQAAAEFGNIPTIFKNQIGCNLTVNLMLDNDIQNLSAVVNNCIQFICDGVIGVIHTIYAVTGFGLAVI